MTSGPIALGYDTGNCQVGRAMALLGRPSTIVVLRRRMDRVDDLHDVAPAPAPGARRVPHAR